MEADHVGGGEAVRNLSADPSPKDRHRVQNGCGGGPDCGSVPEDRGTVTEDRSHQGAGQSVAEIWWETLPRGGEAADSSKGRVVKGVSL